MEKLYTLSIALPSSLDEKKRDTAVKFTLPFLY